MRAVARGCRALAVALLLASSAAGAAAADTPDARAAAIVAAAAAATGGAAWDNLKEIHLTLHRQSGDDTADEEVWFDPHQGAAVVAIEDGPQAGRIGFDGKTAWSAESDGTGEVLKGAERADVIAETLWRSAVWIRHPPGGATWLRDEGQGTHAHDVIRIAAADAAVLEIAFDRANHLPVRVTVHRSDGDETMRLSQWRRTDGASLPWHIDIETANSRVAETVASAVGSAAFNAARFAVPTTPLVDYVFPGEALSAALPIKLLNGHVRLETHVGKQRLQTLFETGAKAALDPNAVQRLGLATHTGAGGETNVRLPEFGVGGVTLKHQTIAVRDLSPLAALEGVPVDAVIGVELARRLVVELDYEGRRMVLLRPDGFVAPPTATPVPLTFAGRIPTVTGRIDGIPATLSLDTGTAAGLVLGDGFAKAHGLVEKWHPVPALVAVGTTPPVLAQLGRAASLELGVLGVAQPLTWISAAPPPAGDGVLGNGVLRRYDAILDYRHGKLWLQPNRSAAAPETIDLSGMAVAVQPAGLVITDVVPQGAADRAGLKPGDVIDLVGGDPAAALGLPEIRTRLAGTPGAGVSLRVKRDGDIESYRIILADPLAGGGGK